MQTYILQELCDHLGLSSIGTVDAEISQGHRRALKMACTTTLVKVSSGPIRTCLQCPLCFNLVHEATTISECLHTCELVIMFTIYIGKKKQYLLWLCIYVDYCS